MYAKGRLEVICGAMFSGKSRELIRRITRSEFAHRKVVVFKHSINDHMINEHIHAHSGESYKAIALKDPADMELFIRDDISLIGIDDIHFFPSTILKTIFTMIDAGKSVIATGLDLDFRGYPFGIVPTLMAVAHSITKLNAVCFSCGKDACHSQRLIEGQPASAHAPISLIGSKDHYQARCRNCFVIDKPLWDYAR